MCLRVTLSGKSVDRGMELEICVRLTKARLPEVLSISDSVRETCVENTLLLAEPWKESCNLSDSSVYSLPTELQRPPSYQEWDDFEDAIRRHKCPFIQLIKGNGALGTLNHTTILRLFFHRKCFLM